VSRLRAAPISGVKHGMPTSTNALCKTPRISRVVPNLPDGIEVSHGLNVGATIADDEGGGLQAGSPGVEVDPEVGVRPQESIEQEACVTARGARAVLVSWLGLTG
jgi:hypothetical protein